MRVPSAVLNLHEHTTASDVHSICHAAPPGNLLDGIDSWGTWIALCLRADGNPLRNDEPGRGTLRVVLSVQCGGNIARTRAHARKRRHHNAVRKLDRAQS